MAHKHTIEELKFRKHILEQRTEKDNYNIIKKIDRNISKLARKRKQAGIGKRILLNLYEDWSKIEAYYNKCYINYMTKEVMPNLADITNIEV